MNIVEIHEKCRKILTAKLLQASSIDVRFRQHLGEIMGHDSPTVVEIAVAVYEQPDVFIVSIRDTHPATFSIDALMKAFDERCSEISANVEVRNMSIDI